MPLTDGSDWFTAVTEGDSLPDVELPVPYARVVAIAGATWDYYPGHHNPSYAQNMGHEGIFLSTMFLCGFVDRVVTDWAGPSAFVRSRRLNMGRSIYAGEVVVARSTVRRKVQSDDGAPRVVEVDISLNDSQGEAMTASVGVTLDDWHGFEER